VSWILCADLLSCSPRGESANQAHGNYNNVSSDFETKISNQFILDPHFCVKLSPSWRTEISANGNAISLATIPQRFLLELGMKFHLQVGRLYLGRLDNPFYLLFREIGDTNQLGQTSIH